jgi:hypothetical protein
LVSIWLRLNRNVVRLELSVSPTKQGIGVVFNRNKNVRRVVVFLVGIAGALVVVVK